MSATLAKSRPIRGRRTLAALSMVVASTIGFTLISTTSAHASDLSVKATDLPSFGDNGASVVRLQQALTARGFTLRGGITGNFDAATRA